jgi:hypothetical protein
MRDIFSELLHLFKGVIVKDITSFDTFDVTFTFPELKTDYFNFILPTVSFEKFNWDLAEKTIEEYKSRNVPIHYYLRSNTQQAFIDYLATQGKKEENQHIFTISLSCRITAEWVTSHCLNSLLLKDCNRRA